MHGLSTRVAASIALVTGGAAARAQAPRLPQPPDSAGGAEALSRQSSDPTASLMTFNVIADVYGSYWQQSGEHGLTVRFQPVIPYRVWRVPNILRVVVPFQVTGPGNGGLGDVDVFNLTMFETAGVRIGVGPVVAMAARTSDVPARFAFGPAAVVVKQRSAALLVGVLSQNQFGAHYAVSELQPIVAYQLGRGYSVAAGELLYTYDWANGRWLNVPIGASLAKVAALGTQPVRLAVSPQYNLRDFAGAPRLKVSVTFAVLAPER